MSAIGKQDMSMDDILASIRSYVSEGQNFPKSESLSTEKASDVNPYDSQVIHLTDEVIPIETVSLLTPVQNFSAQQSSASYNAQVQAPATASDNPFSKLQNKIASSAPAPLSSDELLNQLASPLIKNWLDQNLRKIVEDIVEKEIERMRRG